MKEIKLTQGHIALVDAEDFEFINQWKWQYCSRYASRVTARPNRIRIFMHRVILKTPEGLYTDHINHNTLDNRKENLRICNNSENQCNSGINIKNNTSGYKGVCRKHKKWEVTIRINHQNTYLGRFNDVIDAIKCYDLASLKYHGEFAFTNFDKGEYICQ